MIDCTKISIYVYILSKWGEKILKLLIIYLLENFSVRFIITTLILTLDIVMIIIVKSMLRFNRLKNLPFFLYPNYIFAIGIFVSLISFFLMSYTSPIVARAADALVVTVRVFGFDILINDLSGEEFYKTVQDSVYDFYLLHILRILAPLITLRAALSIFRDYLTQIKYFFCFYKEPHIFSALNEKSICLAKDIYNKKKFIKPLIIFENITTELEDADEGLISATKEMAALFTKKHILNFHFMRLFGMAPSIYLIDNDDHINLKNATNLFEVYKRHKYKFYVFTTSPDSEFFIDALDKENNKSKIHLINQPQIIAYNLMVEKPLFTGIKNNPSSKISVLIIGAGRIGMECAKTAMWCSRMQKYGFEIRIIDSVDREKEFEKEHHKFKENIANAGIDLNYKFIQADINSPEFIKCLHTYSNYNYIIVATGNDELTINTALRTKIEIIRKRVDNKSYSFSNLPVIAPIILNDNYYELFKEYVSKQEDASMFFPFGVNSEIFSLKYTKSWFIDDLAMAYFNIYEGLPINYYNEDYFIEKECNKRSNRAAAIHTLYKLHDLGVSFSANNDYCIKNIPSDSKSFFAKNKKKYILCADKISESDSENIKKHFEDYGFIKQLLNIEHERWAIFSILDGWNSWDRDDMVALHPDNRCPINRKNHKLIEGKLHGCIVSSDMLSVLVNSNLPEISSNNIISPKNKNEQKLRKLAEQENEEKVKIEQRYSITNKFYKNDFGVCWVAYDVIQKKYKNIFYFNE